MAGSGAPTTSPIDGSGLRIVVIAGTWHEQISNGLIAGASRALDEAGASWSLVRVPGSFELPVASKVALEAGADAVVALGVIIRGGTPHFEYVCDAFTAGLTRVSLDTGVPIGNGVLTTEGEGQARDRAGLEDSAEDKGWEATVAALDTAVTLRGLRAPKRDTGFGIGNSA